MILLSVKMWNYYCGCFRAEFTRFCLHPRGLVVLINLTDIGFPPGAGECKFE